MTAKMEGRGSRRPGDELEPRGERLLARVVEHKGKLRLRDMLQRQDAELVGEGAEVGTVVEAISWRSRSGWRLGKVVRTLASPGSARAKVYRLLASQGLTPFHPAEVEEEARRWAESSLELAGLEDLTELPFVTIDNEDSRDLDQALYIERDETSGGYLVWYALADASHFVRPGSALFREALVRGASYYLPGVTIPMLPTSLSEGIVSLNEGVLRRALTLCMALDREGHRRGTRVYRAVIRSRAKLTYDGVQRFHDDPASSPIVGKPYEASLRLLREVGELRMALAAANHVVSYDRPEVEVSFRSDRGEVFAVTRVRRNEVERWNEQISLLCNMEGARLLAEANDEPHVQPVYRVHPRPTPEALASLRRSIDALVHAQGLDPRWWSWQPEGDDGSPGEPLAEYLARLRGRCHEQRCRRVLSAIERLAIRTTEAASFTIEPGPHYGVGAPFYSRISAPMREVVGVFTHKELLERLGDPAEAADAEQDERLRRAVIEAGNRARNLQRQLTKESERLVMDQVFQEDLQLKREQRPWRPGTVVSVRPSRLYVELDDPPLEVKVYAPSLGVRDHRDLDLDEAEVSLKLPGDSRGYVLGDEVRLRVDHAERGRMRWFFDVRRA